MTDDDTERRREDAGQFGPEFDDEQFVKAVEQLQPATSGDVAEAVGCSRSSARRRLRELESDGELESSEVGGYQVWSVS